MPSSESHQPNRNKGYKGTFRRKMAEIMNPSKSGPKIGSGFMKSRSSYACSTTTTQTDNPDQDRYVNTGNVALQSTAEDIVNDVDVGNNETTTVTNITIEHNGVNLNTNDGNNNRVPSFRTVLSPEQEILSNENMSSTTAATDENTNIISSTSTSDGETCSTFTSTSSSLHHQRLHRQITQTSEVKTSSVKSGHSEIMSNTSKMKNFSFVHPKFCNSFGTILNSKETINRPTVEINNSIGSVPVSEPVITYPESPTPSSTSTMLSFPGSRKNSLAAEEILNCNSPGIDLNNELKFEQKRSMSTSSRAKMITEQFKTAESLHRQISSGAATALQTGSMLEESLDTKHEQRTLISENATHQQSQNVSSSTVKFQTDSSFSSGTIHKATQRQISSSSSSSGLYSQGKMNEKQNNFSSLNEFSASSITKLKHVNTNFITNEVDAALNLERQSSLADYLNDNFLDLSSLHFNSSETEVDRAAAKYSDRLKHVVQTLKEGKTTKIPTIWNKVSEMLTKAWLVPTHGHKLGNQLSRELRESGGLDLLIANCDSEDNELKFSSAKVLQQCLTTENRAYVANNGLEKVVSMTGSFTRDAKSPDFSRISTGILEHLFKHNEGTCESVIRLGGLDTLLYECRTKDLDTLRHCASALANLSLYGNEIQDDMIKKKVPMWLFLLINNDDDNVKYYACLAIAVLVANKEMEAAVQHSGTLKLVEPFYTSRNPFEFAKSNMSQDQGQSEQWLRRLVPVLDSKRPEARNLAAFHFCMEAVIKKAQSNTKIFHDIGAIKSLQKVASCPNAIASKFAAQALKLIGEDVPHKLIQQVPLWSVEDVKQWVTQIGFSEYSNNFEQSRVDGDLLLQLTEENLIEDLGISNGIRRRRFTRELQNLKKVADYSSRDVHSLNNFLQCIGPDFTVYTYSMLNAGVDKDCLKSISEDQLLRECGITNSIHRIRILESIKREVISDFTLQADLEKPLNVFISYRRSNGSQLASLLKVHLQVRNFSVFLDVEKLEAGKFDNNLLQSIKQASNFILVLTPSALDRCIKDVACKDWVHREIVAALQSQCNIIPITDNFQWPEPEQLPEDMRAICRFNGIKWVHDYQDACVDKLERFIKGEVNSKNVYQDLCITSPHGGRSLRNEAKIPNLKVQSNDSIREIEVSKDT